MPPDTGVLRESVNLLLEGTPSGIDPERVTASLSTIDGILGVHHLHIWALGGGETALTAHLVRAESDDRAEDGQVGKGDDVARREAVSFEGPAGLTAAVAKARICLRALEVSRVWQDLEACPAERVVVSDTPEAFVHEGWPIYAGPDLVYCPDDQRVVILDWKTGDDSDAELQIPLYALYCRSVLGLRFREEAWFGRVVNLATGDDTTREITRYDLMLAAERVRHSVGAMQAMLADPDRNEPLYLYCGGGFRSVLAAENLQKMGYRNVWSIDGGWRALKDLLPVE